MRPLEDDEMDALLNFFAPEGSENVLGLTDERFDELTKKAADVEIRADGVSQSASLRRYAAKRENVVNTYKIFTRLMQRFNTAGGTKEQREASPRIREILMDFKPYLSPDEGTVRIDEAIGRMKQMYVKGAYYLSAPPADKLREGLQHLTQFAKALAGADEWRIFGNPYYIRTVYELSQPNVAASEEEVNAWSAFSEALQSLSRVEGCPIYKEKMIAWFEVYTTPTTKTLIDLKEQSKAVALACHPNSRAELEQLYDGKYDSGWDSTDFLKLAQTMPPKQAKSFFTPPHGEEVEEGELKKVVKKLVKKVDGVDKKVERTLSIVKGDGDPCKTSRTTAKNQLIKKILDKYWELQNKPEYAGKKSRNALTDAMNDVVKGYGLAGYKDKISLRNVLVREKQKWG